MAGCAHTTRLSANAESREPDQTLFLWPEGLPEAVPPGLSEQIVERENPYGLLDRAALNVTTPSLTVFRSARPDGTALLLIPGGGYRWVVVDKEGFEGARVFSAPPDKRPAPDVFVLRYRLPHQGWKTGAYAPLEDARQAMIRVRAWMKEERGLASEVNVCGFSAGGHLAGWLAYTASGAQRPNRAALIYPVALMSGPFAHKGSVEHLLTRNGLAAEDSGLALPEQVTGSAPPTFLLHATDDASVPVENSLSVWQALRQNGVVASLHVFTSGGHGFGMRGIKDTERQNWPLMLLDWLGQKS